MNIRKIKTNQTIIPLVFITMILNTNGNVPPQPSLGKGFKHILATRFFLKNSKELPKHIKDIDDNAVMLIFFIETKIDEGKIEIKPINSAVRFNNGFNTINSPFEFAFTLNPVDQKFKVLRAEIKGKKNILGVQSVLKGAMELESNNLIGEKKLNDLKKVWKEASNNKKIYSIKMVETEDIIICRIKSLERKKLKPMTIVARLEGEDFFEGFKPALTIDVKPWDSPTYKIRAVPARVEKGVDLGSKIISDLINEDDEEISFKFDLDTGTKIEKIVKILEKDVKVYRSSSDTVKSEAIDTAFYKQWWFITIIILVAVATIGIGVALAFRRRILKNKNKNEEVQPEL